MADSDYKFALYSNLKIYIYIWEPLSFQNAYPKSSGKLQANMSVATWRQALHTYTGMEEHEALDPLWVTNSVHTHTHTLYFP